MAISKEKEWDWQIKPETTWWGTSLAELWAYRHLVVGIVRRDFLLSYQQTVLGPLWVLLQPIMTLVTYVIVFGKVIGIPTRGIPPILFYLASIVLWNLFNDAFTGTSSTFRDNAAIFKKVYIPRLIMPFAQLSGHLVRFIIQLALLLLVMGGYLLFTPWTIANSALLLLVPVTVVLVAGLSLALGLIMSVLTGKYRDLLYVVSLGVRLLMFLTPVIYPLSYVSEKWRWLVQLNPLTSLFELFRLALLGAGQVTASQFLYSLLFTGALLIVALLTFNKQGDKLIDIV